MDTSPVADCGGGGGGGAGGRHVYGIQYDDGDSEAVARPEHMRRGEPTAAAPAEVPPPAAAGSVPHAVAPARPPSFRDQLGNTLAVNDRVEARYMGSSTFYPGVVVAARDDGAGRATFSIAYDDGDLEEEALGRHMRLTRRGDQSATPLSSRTCASPTAASSMGASEEEGGRDEERPAPSLVPSLQESRASQGGGDSERAATLDCAASRCLREEIEPRELLAAVPAPRAPRSPAGGAARERRSGTVSSSASSPPATASVDDSASRPAGSSSGCASSEDDDDARASADSPSGADSWGSGSGDASTPPSPPRVADLLLSALTSRRQAASSRGRRTRAPGPTVAPAAAAAQLLRAGTAVEVLAERHGGGGGGQWAPATVMRVAPGDGLVSVRHVADGRYEFGVPLARVRSTGAASALLAVAAAAGAAVALS